MGKDTVNVAPRPSPGLAASTVPPCLPTSSRTIAKPSPRPPCNRVVELSACRNRSKITGSMSSAIPTPLSMNRITACDRARSNCTVTRPPRDVNLTAFDKRFQKICCNRSGSPITGPTSGSKCVSRATPFSTAVGRILSSAAASTFTRSTGRAFSRNRPARILDTSSRSSIRLACCFAFRPIVSTALATRPGSCGVLASNCVQPRMAFRGVRSSCDSVTRNSSLARFAASASVRACCSRASSSSRSLAELFTAVMSRAIFEAPMICPVWSRTGETVNDTSICRPSFARRTVSK